MLKLYVYHPTMWKRVLEKIPFLGFKKFIEELSNSFKSAIYFQNYTIIF